MSFYSRGAEISGWSGIIKICKAHFWEPVGYKPKDDLPSYLYGEITLYPRRTDRYVYLREFGWAQLDLYFRVYKSETIKLLMDIKLKTPLLFWGKIKSRYSGTELSDLSYELDLDGIMIDKTRGKHSYLQANLQCSNALELGEG